MSDTFESRRLMAKLEFSANLALIKFVLSSELCYVSLYWKNWVTFVDSSRRDPLRADATALDEGDAFFFSVRLVRPPFKLIEEDKRPDGYVIGSNLMRCNGCYDKMEV